MWFIQGFEISKNRFEVLEPTHTYQCGPPMNNFYQHDHFQSWFNEQEPLDVNNASTHRSLVARTSKCGWAISCKGFGLKFMTFVWASVDQAMTSSWGKGCQGWARDPAPLDNPAKLFIFWISTNNRASLPNSNKTNCPCNLEGHLSTNPMLSALHLVGPKFNVDVHFPLVISN